MLVAKAITFVITVANTMILARLLTPGDFGLFAMATTLTALVSLFRDFGLVPAIVYQEEIAHLHLSQAFWLSVRLNAALAIFMIAMMPVLVWFYREPRLVAGTLVLIGGAFVLGLSYIHTAILQREMRFGVIAAQNAGSLLVGALVGVSLALAGAGYGALVGQQLTMYLVQAGIVWRVCPWRPLGYISVRKTKQDDIESIRSYSRQTIIARLFGVRKELDRILVGRYAGTAGLGLYQAARGWAILPIDQMLTPIKALAVSSMSRLHKQPAAYRRYVHHAFLAVHTVLLPALVFIVLFAPVIVRVLLGTQWLAAIPLLRILGIAAIFDSFNRLTTWIYLSNGQTERRMRWTFFSTPVAILGIVLGLPWGVIGVALGYMGATILLAIPAAQYCIRSSPLRSRDFWYPMWRPATAASMAGAFVLLFALVLPGDDSVLANFFVSIVLYSAVYCGCWIILPGGMKESRQALALVRPALRSAWS